ncbi:MAG: hypothetical protein JWP01_2284 [Myxococcales bacterium]|nr:hypothetical protein [Myxococcales bacterium]
MRIPALCTCLVAGLVSVVSAAPDDEETTERVSYKDKDGASSNEGPPRSDGEWVEVADPTPANHGREYITLGADAGTFTRLRVDASQGRPIVKAIRIDFTTGRSRVVNLQIVLDKKRRPSAYVDLKGAREIQQIVVITDRDSKGLYTVNAEVGHGGVASR